MAGDDGNEDDAPDVEATIGGMPPSWLADLIKRNFAGLPPQVLQMMVTSLVSTAVRKLPHKEKIEVMLFIAERLWPGSVSRTE